MSTTIKVSEETRDRIRSFGGSTHEETIIAALDALESEEFWAQADRANAWLDGRPDVRAELDAAAAEWDAAIAAIGLIDAGQIHLADIGQETRRLVLVVSNQRFHRSSRRAIVCPQLTIESDLDELFPWWISSELGVFALDRIASIPVARLLEQRGSLTRVEGARLHRAIAAIT